MADEQIHVTWLNSERPIPRFIRPAVRFSQIEAASGIVLLAAAIAALLWANLAPDSYTNFWSTELDLSFGPLHVGETLQEIVNDGLMAIFFFVVGLEIKRELVLGEFRDPRAAALPAIAALGGMLIPAAIYLMFTLGTGGEALRGWGIPMATDIAFTLGIIALLGSRVSTRAKLFLLALAIADDIGAIVVIAIAYTEDLSLGWLLTAIIGLALMGIARAVGIRSYAFYVPIAIIAWFATLESGVHATIAGVAFGLITPARPMYSAEDFDMRARRILDISPAQPIGALGRDLVDHEALLLAQVTRESVAPLTRLEHALVPWSSFLVVPLFALANVGVNFAGINLGEAATHPVTVGVAVGLVVGKLIGVGGFTWLAVKLKIGRLPRGTDWQQVMGLAALAGIGFTVSLFITDLAFTDEFLTDMAKIGIFAGSLIAGVVGYLLLRRSGVNRMVESPVEDEPAG